MTILSSVYSLQMYSVMGGHIAVVTPLPVLRETGTPPPPATTASPCSTASSVTAVVPSLPLQPDCAPERPAATTMITFSCEKRLFPKNQIRAAAAAASAGGGGGGGGTGFEDNESLFYNSRTNL